MPEQPINVIVCRRGARRRQEKCVHCGRPADKLCDGREPGKRGTCDAPLCAGCATPGGPDVDYCQAHVGQVAQPPRPTPGPPPAQLGLGLATTLAPERAAPAAFPDPLRALTLKQPWAWCMVTGPKRIENRPWPPVPAILRGEWFLLHAGMEYDMGRMEWIAERLGALPPLTGELIAAREWGALVAFARVRQVFSERDAIPVEAGPAWYMGPPQLGWWLEIRALAAPVKCRGWHKLWNVESQLKKDNDEVKVKAIIAGLAAEYDRLVVRAAA